MSRITEIYRRDCVLMLMIAFQFQFLLKMASYRSKRMRLASQLSTQGCPRNTGVALTFEKLRIANAQHEKNCVSSPAAKVTISTDVPKIDKHENTNV